MKDILQEIARKYLRRMRETALKHNIGYVVDNLIKENEREACRATKEDVETLARMCNEERIKRRDVAKEIGKSYRYCNENGIFDKIKILKPLGRLSKTDTLIIKDDIKNGRI